MSDNKEDGYFDPNSYAEADIEPMRQLFLPGMEEFERIVGHLALNREISNEEVAHDLQELED